MADEESCGIKKTDRGRSSVRVPSSLHEHRINETSIRIEPGRYRILSSPYGPTSIGHASTSRIMPNQPNAPRLPVKAIGNGQLIGKTVIPEGSFIKSMEMMPPNLRRRYYPEDSEEIVEEVSAKKSIRLVHYSVTSTSKDGRIDRLSEIDESISEVHKDLLIEEHIESQTAYNEETVDVLTAEPESESSFEHNSVYIRSSYGTGIGNIQLIKQLRGENNYLKDQLELSAYRIKQLEQLLLDRNTRLRALLAENIQLGVNVRKLSQEIGDETAKEILCTQNKA